MSSLLQFMLGDIEQSYFFSNYYGKHPLLVKGYASKFSDVFTLAELNQILNFSSLQYPRVRVTDHHNTIHKYDLIDDKDRYANNINNDLNRRKILLAIARGGTLVYDRIQEFHPPLEAFVDTLAAQLRLRVSVNGYYTAATQRGVNVHFDRHDVFAVQVHGSKRWFYRDDAHILARPMRQQQVPPVDEQCSGWDSVLLEQGDIFYCPRGLWHFTRTEAEHSAHLALGWYPLSLRDWIRQAEQDPEIAEVLETYVQHPSCDDVQHVFGGSLDKLFSLLQQYAQLPLAPAAMPRPRLELE